MGLHISGTSAWKFLVGIAIPILESAGATLESGNDLGKKVLGEGLIYAGDFLQFLLDKSNGKNTPPPVVPASLQTK